MKPVDIVLLIGLFATITHTKADLWVDAGSDTADVGVFIDTSDAVYVGTPLDEQIMPVGNTFSASVSGDSPADGDVGTASLYYSSQVSKGDESLSLSGGGLASAAKDGDGTFSDEVTSSAESAIEFSPDEAMKFSFTLLGGGNLDAVLRDEDTANNIFSTTQAETETGTITAGDTYLLYIELNPGTVEGNSSSLSGDISYDFEVAVPDPPSLALLLASGILTELFLTASSQFNLACRTSGHHNYL